MGGHNDSVGGLVGVLAGDAAACWGRSCTFLSVHPSNLASQLGSARPLPALRPSKEDDVDRQVRPAGLARCLQSRYTPQHCPLEYIKRAAAMSVSTMYGTPYAMPKRIICCFNGLEAKFHTNQCISICLRLQAWQRRNAWLFKQLTMNTRLFACPTSP